MEVIMAREKRESTVVTKIFADRLSDLVEERRQLVSIDKLADLFGDDKDNDAFCANCFI